MAEACPLAFNESHLTSWGHGACRGPDAEEPQTPSAPPCKEEPLKPAAAGSAPCGCGCTCPAPCADQALRGGPADVDGAPASLGVLAATAASHEQALRGVADIPEVRMDGSELHAEPFAEFGALAVAAPPWRPTHVVSSRVFSMVLRNPRDPSRGLTLMSSTSQTLVTQTAQGIIAELGDSAAALADPSFYDALHDDPALLAAVAQSTQLSGGSLQELVGAVAAGSAGGPQNARSGAQSATSVSAEAAPPLDEACECPICYEGIRPGDAAMRCSGEGGVHHYFHATCLQSWISSSRNGECATCPICRGQLQFNGQRLQEFLEGPTAASLNQEERSFLQSIADGLQHKNRWSDMDNLERVAYTGGLAAAAGLGFMLGYNAGHSRAANAANDLMIVPHVPREHQFAQGAGWVAGVLARIIREVLKDKERDRRR